MNNIKQSEEAFSPALFFCQCLGKAPNTKLDINKSRCSFN